MVHRPERGRSEVQIDGVTVGVARYERRGPVTDIEHVIVEPAFEGHGLGSLLVQAVVERARADGDQVVASCSFAAAWVRRHGDDEDGLAP